MTGPPADGIDLSLYLVTDTGLCEPRGIVSTVRDAVRGGVTVVQLRDHDVTDRDFVGLGRLVRSTLRGTDVPLIVNDRAHLVRDIDAQGVHLGQDDLDPVEARALVGDTAYLGLSVSTLAQLEQAHRYPPGTVDYLGVGPVWQTGTKPDHAEPVGPDGAARIVAASRWPTVLIGGITSPRLVELSQVGADGIAVVSALCAAADAAAAARELRAAWQARS